MDPASIAALIGLCASIIRNAANFVSGLDNAINRIKDAKLDITTLRNHCELLQLASGRLRARLESDGSRLKEGERQFILGALDTCDQLLDKLNKLVQKCSRADGLGPPDDKSPGLRKIIRFICSQPQLSKYEKAVQTQLNSVNVIVQTLYL